jgi:hypothetical protein
MSGMLKWSGKPPRRIRLYPRCYGKAVLVGLEGDSKGRPLASRDQSGEPVDAGRRSG